MKKLKNLFLGLLFLLLAVLIERQLNKEDGMDRETRKVWKWWLIAVLLIAVVRLLSGCAPPSVARVVHTTTPYTSVLLLDPSATAAGITGCELGGQPIVYIHPRLPKSAVQWFLLHERVHVEEALGYPGGCFAFSKRYTEDREFRLQAEAQAFCIVFDAQLATGIEPNPNIVQIVAILSNQETYQGHWSAPQILSHLSCGDSNGQQRQRQISPPDGTGVVSQRPP